MDSVSESTRVYERLPISPVLGQSLRTINPRSKVMILLATPILNLVMIMEIGAHLEGR